jgi:hypothetical protein
MTSFFSIAFWISNFCHFLLRKSFFDSGVKIAYYPKIIENTFSNLRAQDRDL